MVADDAQFERDLGGVGEAQRGGHAAVGHRDHHVGLDRRFLGQHRADILARLVDVAPFQTWNPDARNRCIRRRRNGGPAA